MRSQWFEHKGKIIQLRKQGFSYGEIEKLLGVPRSTLSHWLRDIELTETQKQRLQQNYGNGLIKARIKSAQVRQEQKAARIKMAEEEARKVLAGIKIDDGILELALAMLYMGEGSKGSATSIGNSNPLILKFFLTALTRKYGLDMSKIHFDLHIRADQDPQQVKTYWAKELGVPLDLFKYVVADQRTKGKPTYATYKGVCVINCGNVDIQRKLIYLYNLFCERAINEWAVGAAASAPL